MWKYILIALFLLLAIREINLMNQSLYIAPDNKIVAEDRTTATELKKLISHIKQNEFLIKEPETIQETNKTSAKEAIEQTVAQTEQTPTTYGLTETNVTSPQPKETNISTQEAEETHPTLYTPEIAKTKTEQNSTQSSATSLHETTSEEQTPSPEGEPLFKPTIPEKQEHKTLQETSEPKTVPTIPEPVVQKTESPKASAYPKNFESAEERVRKILEEMKAQR